ncbi:hypothetical protein EWM64_g859 [Hericium alpestre]|uniref:Uncharacterized protein n=1 Tax=Hericium alpestre TaxID=135208 RepID=A0A4Z0A9Z4_9AGAM|nr:hypothetical protein EWM64_g859 [Hericium alpestre]
MDYGGLWADVTSRWLSPTRIALPSIEHISVIDEVLCMSNYLSRFSHSHSSNVHYRFTMFDENSPPILNHIRHLAVLDLMSQVSSLIGGPLAYLVFADNVSNDGPCRKLELDANVAPISDDPSALPVMTLIFDCISGDDAHLSCFQVILDGLGGQLTHVEKMMLLDMDPYMAIDWSRPLARLRNLRDLTLSADDPNPIVELMGSVMAEHRNERTGITKREVYLQALEHLKFSLLGRDEELFELVARSLSRRMGLGSRLPVLTMHMVDDPLQPHDERLLSQVVSSLVSENET